MYYLHSLASYFGRNTFRAQLNVTNQIDLAGHPGPYRCYRCFDHYNVGVPVR